MKLNPLEMDNNQLFISHVLCYVVVGIGVVYSEDGILFTLIE